MVAGEVCMVYLGGAWFFWWACMVFLGVAWFFQGVHVFSGGACFFGVGMHGFLGGMHGFFRGVCIGYNEIWSMSGQYASYWNVFLF